jgi:predicted membrane protein
MPKRKRRSGRRTAAYAAIVVGILVVLVVAILSFQPHQAKPVILYVNQGNGVVNGSNFVPMLDFASAKGFNIVFFQIYRQGVLLFTPGDLGTFVNETHSHGLRIFFALYITNSSQALPTAVFALGEDGISLDMSTVDLGTQEALLASLQASYHGESAVTTTDMTSTLRPDLLILETYGTAMQQYIRPEIVASVGVFATSSQADYQSQFQYALSNSAGVMVFDYAGLLKSGY